MCEFIATFDWQAIWEYMCNCVFLGLGLGVIMLPFQVIGELMADAEHDRKQREKP
jgi:hypothetical protein